MEILESVKKFNENIALVDKDGERLTKYSELDALSDKLCAKLIKDGIKEGSRIILKFDRGREFVIAFIAVLKAKCVFINIIPEYPDERIEYIKKDSNATLILTIDYFKDIEKYSLNDDYEYNIDENSLACIIYTSGSTGNPKGVIYTRKGIDALANKNDYIKDIDNIVWGAMSQFSFVVSLFEILNVLNLGGTIHIISDNVRSDMGKIEDYYEKYKLTCGFMAPRILKKYKNKDKYLKRLICGGEKLSNFYTDEFEVINHYGQSEALIIAGFKVDKEYETVPIGKAFVSEKIYLLDEKGNEVSNGEEGEICVVGDNSIGYLNLDEKTKEVYEKFNGGLRIHTGDIGKIDENGNLIYINRKDNMIKLHGQRVEPGEIESAINEIEGVESSVVKAFENSDGTMRLVAFYTCNVELEKERIVKKIARKLPSYMIPTNYVYLKEFPLNANGKVDRKSLALPSTDSFLREYVKPSNEIEEKICHAFEKLFNIEKIGIDDNFFELGGNSINTVKVASYIGIKGLSIQMIQMGETPRGIAKIYNENNNLKPDIEKCKSDTNEYRMSLSQIYQYEICKCTNQPLQNMSIPLYYKLPKNIDINKLKNAIYKLVREHKIYSTNYDLETEQIIFNKNDFVITEKKVSDAYFENYRIDTYKKARDYKQDFLFEAEIIATDSETYLRLYIDHLIFDGYSMMILLESISNNYAGIDIKKEELSIFDLISYEKNVENTDFYKDALAYYDSIYKNIDESKLLKMAPDKVTCFKSYEILSDVSKKQLNDYFVKNHTSAITFFMFALDLTIREYFDTNNFTYMNIHNGRYDERLMNTHGCLAKGVFLKSIDMSKSDKISDLFKSLQDDYQKIQYYDVISFKDILARYKNIRSGIIFNYKEDVDTSFEIENEKLNSEFIVDALKIFKLYVDMDISISKQGNDYYMMINTVRLTDLEVIEFENIYDRYCHKLLECDDIKKIIEKGE